MMACKFIARDALRGLLSAPLRSFISVFSLMLGAVTLIILLNLNYAAKLKIEETLESIGPQLMTAWVLHSGHTAQPITPQSIDRLLDAHHSLNILPYHNKQEDMTYHSQDLKGTVVVSQSEILKHLNVLLKQTFGGDSPPTEMSALIGYDLAKQYDVRLGETIWINQKGYLIHGILEKGLLNPLLDFDYNKSVFISEKDVWDEHTYLEYFLILYPKSWSIENAKQLFSTLIQNYYDKELKIYFRDESLFTDTIRRSMASYQQVFIWLVALSLTLSSIGVMSQQWMAFVQRRGECGMRLSLGASKQELFLLFIFESMLLGCLGAFIGTPIGLLGLKWVLGALEWPFFWHIGWCLSAIVGCITLSTISGILPAVIAAQSQPVKLLTYQ